MRNILITGPVLAEEAVAQLKDAGCSLVFSEKHQDMVALVKAERPDAIILRQGRIDETVLACAPGLRIVAKHGAGYNTIDVAAATRRGIPVTVTPGANATSVAEHTMALMLAVAKDLSELDRRLRAGDWVKPVYRGFELAGATLGLVGYGAIGQRVAALASIFELDVVYFDPHATPGGASVARRASSLEALLSEADILSLHCPLTEATRGLLDRKAFASLKPGALFINTARAELVDDPALACALETGQVAAAGIDCFAAEPPDPRSRLFQMPNVLLTPHIGGCTHASFRRMGKTAASCVLAALDNKLPPKECLVNNVPARQPVPVPVG